MIYGMTDDEIVEAMQQLATENEILNAKLAKAVSWLETIRDRAKGDYMANTYYLDALAALATIGGEKK
jgi:hypothetical protein